MARPLIEGMRIANGALTGLVILACFLRYISKDLELPILEQIFVTFPLLGVVYYLAWQGLGPESTMEVVRRALLSNSILAFVMALLIISNIDLHSNWETFLVELLPRLLFSAPFALNIIALGQRSAEIDQANGEDTIEHIEVPVAPDVAAAISAFDVSTTPLTLEVSNLGDSLEVSSPDASTPPHTQKECLLVDSQAVDIPPAKLEDFSNIMQFADSIAIVVHGVGDHSPVEILEEGYQGFTDLAKARGSSAHSRPGETYLAIKHVNVNLQTLQRTRNRQALLILSPAQHCIIPIVWSRLRTRLMYTGDENRYSPDENFAHAYTQIGEFFKNGMIFLKAAGWDLGSYLGSAVLVALLPLCFLYFTIGFALLATPLILYFMVPFAYIAGTLYVREFVSAVSESVVLPDLFKIVMFFAWGYIPYVFSEGALRFAKTLLASLNSSVLAWLDFLGDVMWYLAHPNRRQELEEHFISVLEEVAQKSPRATLIVIGHSLGSVFVANALLRLRLQSPAAGRVLLITLGSPLRLLSVLFPTIIPSPRDLARTWNSGNLVIHWYNFWRQWDVIGRALFWKVPPIVTERCLGQGGHVNYWHDVRLWEQLGEILTLVSEQK